MRLESFGFRGLYPGNMTLQKVKLFTFSVRAYNIIGTAITMDVSHTIAQTNDVLDRVRIFERTNKVLS